MTLTEPQETRLREHARDGTMPADVREALAAALVELDRLRAELGVPVYEWEEE